MTDQEIMAKLRTAETDLADAITSLESRANRLAGIRLVALVRYDLHDLRNLIAEGA